MTEQTMADQAQRYPVTKYPIDRESGYDQCMAASNLAYWEAVAARRKLQVMYSDTATNKLLNHVNSILVILDPRYWRQLSKTERQNVSADARQIGETYVKAEDELHEKRKAESARHRDKVRAKYRLSPYEAKAVLQYAMRHRALFVSYDIDLLTDGDLKLAAETALHLMKDVKVQQAVDWLKEMEQPINDKGEA